MQLRQTMKLSKHLLAQVAALMLMGELPAAHPVSGCAEALPKVPEQWVSRDGLLIPCCLVEVGPLQLPQL